MLRGRRRRLEPRQILVLGISQDCAKRQPCGDGQLTGIHALILATPGPAPRIGPGKTGACNSRFAGTACYNQQKRARIIFQRRSDRGWPRPAEGHHGGIKPDSAPRSHGVAARLPREERRRPHAEIRGRPWLLSQLLDRRALVRKFQRHPDPGAERPQPWRLLWRHQSRDRGPVDSWRTLRLQARPPIGTGPPPP